MCSTVSSDRHSAAVRAVLSFDTPPRVTYRRDADRVVVSVGTVAVMVSPGVAGELAFSLRGAVDAAEGHWEPEQSDEPDAGAGSAEETPSDG